MAKRFTDTNKYKKPFIRSLPGAYKLLWDFLYHDCDHAGIWIVDFEIAQLYIGKDMPVDQKQALMYFNFGEQRVVEIADGKKWFIPSFIEIQYGVLNPENRAHNSVINELIKYNLYVLGKGLISPLEECKDKEKEKDKEKKGGVGGNIPEVVREFYRDQFEQSKTEPFFKEYCGLVGYIFNEKYKNPIDEPAYHILRVSKQLTYVEFTKLKAEAKKRGTSVKEKINSMINHKKYTKDIKSLYLTLLTWIKKHDIQGTNL